MLRLDRLRALVNVYPGVDREDEMVAAFDFCLHGRGGAAPSIDTAMHGLVAAPHVDHLHPDSGIALATAADGEKLTARVLRRPGGVGAVAAAGFPARPGHRGDRRGQPAGDRGGAGRARHHRLGRDRRGVRGPVAGDHPDRGASSSRRTARPSRSARSPAEPLPEAERHARAAELAPVIRGLASTDRPQVGHYADAEVVLDFISRAEHPRLAALGTSCPDHFLRTKVRPMVLDLPPDAPLPRPS